MIVKMDEMSSTISIQILVQKRKYPMMNTETNVPIEIRLQVATSYVNPFMDVILDVEFLAPDGTTKKVPPSGPEAASGRCVTHHRLPVPTATAASVAIKTTGGYTGLRKWLKSPPTPVTTRSTVTGRSASPTISVTLSMLTVRPFCSSPTPGGRD